MAEARDVDQIEYRWDSTRDMSPVASSLAPDSIERWNRWVRSWVRHPNVDAPSESVCYQISGSKSAAFAWRYRDQAVARSFGGPGGRPVVSRVLVGLPSVLTPDVAIALCRTGLPASAGPPAGQAGASLPAMRAAELTALAREQAAKLDGEAAQASGLRQVVAKALSDLDTPLAIQLRDPYILHPPQQGMQSLLLWALWRIMSPLTGDGAGRRAWSFSTFELPMGDMDPGALPDIVFRLAQAAPAAPPANARNEIRVRLGDTGDLTAADSSAAELAAWLVQEYQEGDGDQLREFIAGCAGGLSSQARLVAVHDALRGKWSPIVRSPGPQPAREYWDEPAVTDAFGTTGESGEADPFDDVRDLVAPAALAGPASMEPPPALGIPAAVRVEDPPVSGPPTQPALLAVLDEADRPDTPVAGLIWDLAAATDRRTFEAILRDLVATAADRDGRIEAREWMSELEWCVPAFERYGYRDCAADLARIFQHVVMPDLDQEGLTAVIGNWVRDAPAVVVAALLEAAKMEDGPMPSGTSAFRLVSAAAGDAALQRLLEISGIQFDWPHHQPRGPRPGSHRAEPRPRGKLWGMLPRATHES